MDIGCRRDDGSWFMCAYYYSFEPTGVDAIDAILSEVASAGKAYHHTESWTDDYDGEIWKGVKDKRNHAQRIQDAANAAAQSIAEKEVG